jgi:hypothetical protein
VRSIRPLVRLVVALLLVLSSSAAAWAQGKPEIDIRISPTNYPPVIAVRGVLAEKPFDEMVRSGFPARLHVRAELWSEGRWFDDVNGRAEWDIIVRYDVIDRSYEVVRRVTGAITSLGSYTRFADARAAMELAFSPSLPSPPRGKKSYVLVQAELQSLQVSDLDELDRWLRGEAAPAVQGKRSPASALTRGVRTLASRLLGGEVRRLEARSPSTVF